MNWLVEKTSGPGFIFVNENTVLHPDTMGILLEDVDSVKKIADSKLGVMGTRSNDVVGPQNIRADNGGTLSLNAMNYDSEDTVFQVGVVYPVAAWYSRAAFDGIGGWIPQINELTDEVYSIEARARDWELYVSRAYVHHAPPTSADLEAQRLRTSQDLLWMRKNRLDLYEIFED